MEETHSEQSSEEQIEGKLIGEVFNYFEKVGVAALKIEGELKTGDTIRIVGGEETDFQQTVDSMQVHNQTVNQAKPGDEVGIKVSEKVRKGYKIYKL